MAERTKKTKREFMCRDHLWEMFEQMGADLDCSVDFLINEAMRQYARSQEYGGPASSAGTWGTNSTQASRKPSSPGLPSTQAPAPAPTRAPAVKNIVAAAAPPSTTVPPAQANPSYPPHPAPPPTPAPSIPPPLPGTSSQAQALQSANAPPLSVIFNGQKIPVKKTEFIIGRGSRSSDLAIKDGNISRRHAAVVFEEGAYYIRDLGSTNGIEYDGRRIESKAILEGDSFMLCDYEVQFTYH